MADTIYNLKLLEIAAAIPHSEQLAHPQATATAHSKLCSSTVTVDLDLVQDRVSAAFGQTVKACPAQPNRRLDVMGREIMGTGVAEIRAAVGQEMQRMLKEGGPPPSGRSPISACSSPCATTRPCASTLLVFDAVEAAILKIESERAAQAGGQPRAARA